MAVAPYVSGFTPTVITEPAGSPFLRQRESAPYQSLQKNVKDAFDDLRDDVEDAFVRSLSLGQVDPDMDLGTALVDPRGVVTVEGPIDASDSTESIVLNVNLTGAEPSGDDPDFGSVTVGTGNSAFTLTDPRPGNGDRHRPHGDRTLVVVDDRDGALNQSLAVEIGNTDINNQVYRVVVIKLATDGAGAVTTIANDLEALAGLIAEFTVAAGGTGLGVVAATTEPQQMTGGVGGYYNADIPGTTVTQAWDIGAGTCTLSFDATDFADDEVVTCHLWLNGEHTSVSIPTLSGVLGTSAPATLASTANGEGASLIGVEDAGGYFSGANVEAVLASLGLADYQPAIAVGTEAGEAIAFTITGLCPSKVYSWALYESDGTLAVVTDFTVAATVGVPLFADGNPRGAFTSSAGGACTLTVTDLQASTKTMSLVVLPVTASGRGATANGTWA